MCVVVEVAVAVGTRGVRLEGARRQPLGSFAPPPHPHETKGGALVGAEEGGRDPRPGHGVGIASEGHRAVAQDLAGSRHKGGGRRPCKV